VHRGKRRAACPLARVCGLQLSVCAVGRTGQSAGSLRPHCHTPARRKNSRAASSPRNGNRAHACRRPFGSSCVQLTPFARPPVACATAYGIHACVPPCASASVRGRHGQRGQESSFRCKHSAKLQDAPAAASATTFCRLPLTQDPSLSPSAVSFVSQRLKATLTRAYPRKKATNCLLAAQLCGSTRPGAVAWPGGRAASCLLVGMCQGGRARYGARPGEPLCR